MQLENNLQNQDEKLLKFNSNKNRKSKIIVLRLPTIIGNNSKINLVDYIYNQSLLYLIHIPYIILIKFHYMDFS